MERAHQEILWLDDIRMYMPFKEGSGMMHVTNHVQIERTPSNDDFQVTIIDTPGFFDSDGYDKTDEDYVNLRKRRRQLKNEMHDYERNHKSDEKHRSGKLNQYQQDIEHIEADMKQRRLEWRANTIKKSILAACFDDGIDAFLVVERADKRFSDNEREMLAFMQKEYGGSHKGPNILDYTFVLMTHFDHILYRSDNEWSEKRTEALEEQAVKNWLESEEVANIDSFQEFLKQIDNRILYIDNCEAKEHGANYYQRNLIFNAINEHVMIKRHGQPFTNDQFLAARQHLKTLVTQRLTHLEAPKKELERVTEKYNVVQKQISQNNEMVKKAETEMKQKTSDRKKQIENAERSMPDSRTEDDGYKIAAAAKGTVAGKRAIFEQLQENQKSKPMHLKPKPEVVEKLNHRISLAKNTSKLAKGQRISSTKLCRAQAEFSFDPKYDDELCLEKGDIIENVEDAGPGCLKGTLRGRVGVFPANYVKIISSFQATDDVESESSDVDDTSNNPAIAQLKKTIWAIHQENNRLEQEQRQLKEEIYSLEKMDEEAEEKVTELAKMMREQLVNDTKWARRSEKFKAAIKGIFVFKTNEYKREREEKHNQLLDNASSEIAEILLEKEYPDLYKARQWQKEYKRQMVYQEMTRKLQKGVQFLQQVFQT